VATSGQSVEMSTKVDVRRLWRACPPHAFSAQL